LPRNSVLVAVKRCS